MLREKLHPTASLLIGPNVRRGSWLRDTQPGSFASFLRCRLRVRFTRSKALFWMSAHHFRSPPTNRHSQSRLGCLERANRRHGATAPAAISRAAADAACLLLCELALIRALLQGRAEHSPEITDTASGGGCQCATGSWVDSATSGFGLFVSDLTRRLARPAMKRASEVRGLTEPKRESDILVGQFGAAKIF